MSIAGFVGPNLIFKEELEAVSMKDSAFGTVINKKKNDPLKHAHLKFQERSLNFNVNPSADFLTFNPFDKIKDIHTSITGTDIERIRRECTETKEYVKCLRTLKKFSDEKLKNPPEEDKFVSNFYKGGVSAGSQPVYGTNNVVGASHMMNMNAVSKPSTSAGRRGDDQKQSDIDRFMKEMGCERAKAEFYLNCFGNYQKATEEFLKDHFSENQTILSIWAVAPYRTTYAYG
eukprot:TRINITY_DN1462_c0_g1_i3.p1 TRINITY_DN1462_c0_g1~~TRINITY_DN1462_c0_g1_i3.p1  ORF type:complete len:231 (+),score=42.31 TRINITY_DN1462_c0_g1_i3:215-907(+)